MRVSVLLSTVGLIAMSCGPALAQDRVIGGTTVPSDQVAAFQAKCDELRTQGSTEAADDAANPDAAASTEAAPAAGAAASSEAPAAGAAPSSEAPAAGAATSTEAAPAAGAAGSANAEVNIETLTVEQCDEGGFVAKQ